MELNIMSLDMYNVQYVKFVVYSLELNLCHVNAVTLGGKRHDFSSNYVFKKNKFVSN